jgi:PAS domain S-box-containing protein
VGLWGALLLAAPAVVAADDPGVAPASPRRSSDTNVEKPSPLNAAQARALPPARAAKGLPAELNGTVTYIDQYNLFVADNSGSIYVRPEWPAPAPVLKIGDRIRLIGHTGPGDFAPIVVPERVEVLGSGPLPKAMPASLRDLASGRLDSQWVTVHGIIQSVRRSRQGHTIFSLSSDGVSMTGRILTPPNAPLPTGIVNTHVRLDAVALTNFTGRRQFLATILIVPSPDHLAVEERPTASELRRLSLAEIGVFSLEPDSGHAIETRATVTWSNGRRLALADGTAVIFADLDESKSLPPGTVVTARGFAATGPFGPMLQHVSVTPIGKGAVPVATNVPETELLSPEHHGELVSVRGRVIERVVGLADRQTLVLQVGNDVVRAQLSDRQPPSSLPPVQSVIRVTGVCRLQGSTSAFERGGISGELLLRTVDDIQIVKQAPFWTTDALIALAFMGLVVVAVLGWALALRRRLGRQHGIITEHVEREALLEARFRDLIEHSPDLYYTHELDGRIVALNPAVERITGYSRDSLMGQPIQSLSGDDEHAPIPHAPVDSTFGPQHEMAIFTRDGRRRLLEVSERLVIEGEKAVAVQGVARDVTERRETELALRESERRYRALFDSLPMPVWVYDDVTLAFLSANEAAVKYYGYSREELLSMTILDVRPPEDVPVVLDALERARGSNIFTDTFRHRKKDGTIVEVEVVSHEVVLGGHLSRLAAMRDVTEQQRAHEALERAKEAAEAMSRTKSQFLANMSHELRTPMNGIIGMTRLALEGELSGDQRSCLELVRSSAEALLVILNDILDFSKIEAGRLDLNHEAFDIRELLGTTMQSFATAASDRGIDLWLRVAPDVPTRFVSDANRLRQVMINLVGNGIKFTERGEVALEASVEPAPVAPGEAADPSAPPVLRIAVTDTGIGIQPEHQRVIFEEFRQADGSTSRRYGGTGLGLSISARLVQMLGGAIRVASTPGQGSTFSFTVPLRAADGVAAGPAGLPRVGAPVWVSVASDRGTRAVSDALTTCGLPSEHVLPHDLVHRLQTAATRPAAVVTNEHDEARLSAVRAACGREVPLVRLVRGDGRTGASGSGVEVVVTVPFAPLALGQAVATALEQSASRPGTAPAAPASIEPASMTVVEGTSPRRTSPPVQTGEGRPLRILVAEDHPVNQQLILRLLERRGHKVTIAADGRQAVDAYGRDAFDLIVMDVQMPVMDGFEATAAIRAIEQTTGVHVPIVAVTAHAMDGDRERCLQAGMDDYMSKPIHTPTLLAFVARFGSKAAA